MEARVTVGLVDLVLDAKYEVAIFYAHAHLARVHIVGQREAHGDALGTIGVVDDLRKEVRVAAHLGLLERHLDDQAIAGRHEADQLVRLGLRRQLIGALELADRVVALDFVRASLFASRHHQLAVVLHLGLDGRGREARAVDAHAVLLRHARIQRQRAQELGLVEPMQVAADHVVELVERVEQVESGERRRDERRADRGRYERLRHGGGQWRAQPRVHVEHGARKELVRYD